MKISYQALLFLNSSLSYVLFLFIITHLLCFVSHTFIAEAPVCSYECSRAPHIRVCPVCALNTGSTFRSHGKREGTEDFSFTLHVVKIQVEMLFFLFVI